MTDEDMNQSEEEREIAQLLRAAGKREALPEDMKQRWAEAFAAELAPVIERRRSWRRPALALAASVALIAITVLFYPGSEDSGHSMAVAAISGDSWVLVEDQESPAVVGQSLLPGTTLVTDTRANLAFSWGAYDVRLNAASQVQVFENRVALLAGEIYVSDDAGQASGGGIRIATTLATITDIGTQFTVRWQEGSVVSRVRQGKIVVSAGDEEVTAVPTAGSARQVSVDSEHNVESTTVSADWTWIYQVAPVFEPAGQSVHDFLTWSAEQTGRKLEFADSNVEIKARMAILTPADLSGFDPDSAVDVVLATTDLHAERRSGGTLHVSRRR